MQTSIGYDGWRFDYVKGFGGKYIQKYVAATKPFFAVGEFWDYLNMNNPDAHRQQLCDWLDTTSGTSFAFDFTTKGILQKAVNTGEYWRLIDKENKPAGLIGWWPQRAVTFVDNHDTGPSTGGDGGQNHWPFPANNVAQGYCYILTHPGVPCIYWVHFYDWGIKNELKKLINIRKKYKITSLSKVKIAKAHNNLYAAYIDSKIAMKIGSDNWTPGTEWTLIASGNNYAVWTK
jgi:alpha-amylase